MSFKSGIGGNMLCFIQEQATEVRQTQSGKKVANATVGVAEGYGENKNVVFVQCTFWENDADSIVKYPKNHHLYIEGLITATAYINSNNEPKAQIKCNVQSWRSLQALPKDTPQTEQPVQSQPIQYKEQISQGNKQGNRQQEVQHQQQIQNVGSVNTSSNSKQSDTSKGEPTITLEKSYNHMFNSGSYKGKTIRQVATEDLSYLIRVANERSDKAIGIMCKMVVDDVARVANYITDDDDLRAMRS